jgi:hypothetical protein
VIGRVVSDGVLIAEFFANVLEGLIQIVNVVGEKGAPTGFLGEILENLISIGKMVFAVAGFLLLMSSESPRQTMVYITTLVRWAISMASARV